MRDAGPGSGAHLDPLHLQVGGAHVGAVGVDAVLVGDDLPELGSDLVAALTGLRGRGEECGLTNLTD